MSFILSIVTFLTGNFYKKTQVFLNLNDFTGGFLLIKNVLLENEQEPPCSTSGYETKKHCLNEN